MRPTLGVFELGLIPEHLRDAHPDYATMIIEWLASALPEADFLPVRVVRGEALPEATRCDGYLYSGSRHGVYEPLPWIAPLQAFVRDAARLGRPQFGICFGHQLIASALGGSARLHEGGWNCGVQAYTLEIDGAVRDLPVYVMHQDQVIDTPPMAHPIGCSAGCAVGALDYAAPIRTVQFHPEFSREYIAALLHGAPARGVPEAVATAALASLATPVDARPVAEWVAAFFREHLPNLAPGRTAR